MNKVCGCLPHHCRFNDVPQLGWGEQTSLTVRDLWAHHDVGQYTGSYTVKAVAPHAVVFVRLAPHAHGSRTNSQHARNVTIQLGSNNVQGEAPPYPGVVLLGVVDSFSKCEDACYSYAPTASLHVQRSSTGSSRSVSSVSCKSFTWHHTDFPKPQYQGHCYAHTDGAWHPAIQGSIDSGCRNDIADGAQPDCRTVPTPPTPPGPHPHPHPHPPGPPPPPTPFVCMSDYECAGNSGKCVAGKCECLKGWKGPRCNQINFRRSTGRVAYSSPLWTWGGSPIRDEAGIYHMFSSQISNNCGILHYCVNSQVILHMQSFARDYAQGSGLSNMLHSRCRFRRRH